MNWRCFFLGHGCACDKTRGLAGHTCEWKCIRCGAPLFQPGSMAELF